MPTYHLPDDSIVHAPAGTPSDRAYRLAGHAAVETEDEAAAHDPDAGPTLLAGKALDAALDAAGLSKSGTADEKRQRLAEHGSADDGEQVE